MSASILYINITIKYHDEVKFVGKQKIKTYVYFFFNLGKKNKKKYLFAEKKEEKKSTLWNFKGENYLFSQMWAEFGEN